MSVRDATCLKSGELTCLNGLGGLSCASIDSGQKTEVATFHFGIFYYIHTHIFYTQNLKLVIAALEGVSREHWQPRNEERYQSAVSGQHNQCVFPDHERFGFG